MFSYLLSTTTVNSTRACTKVHETLNLFELVLLQIPVLVFVHTISTLKRYISTHPHHGGQDPHFEASNASVQSRNTIHTHSTFLYNQTMIGQQKHQRVFQRFEKLFYPFKGVSCDSNVSNYRRKTFYIFAVESFGELMRSPCQFAFSPV